MNKARWYIARSLAWGRGEEPPDKDDPEAVRHYLLEHAPPVYDPFCGGGSIPLEAQRLGLRAYGSDLNPVAVMISKALVEFPPKFGGLPPVNPEARRKLANGGAWNAKGAQGLAEDVRYYGRWMRDEAEKRIGHLYPEVKLPNGSKATVIAWLWARTVASPNPACRGAYVPLVSSFMLSTKPGKEAWVEPVLAPSARDGYQFEIRTGGADAATLDKAKRGTKAGKAQDFICLFTGVPIKRTYIQQEGKAGRLGVRLMAIVAEGKRGRVYLPPDPEQEKIAAEAEVVEQARTTFLSGTTPTRAMVTGGVCSAYGLSTWGHLFTPRQLVALTTFSDLVLEAWGIARKDARAAGVGHDLTVLADGGTGAYAYGDAMAAFLAMALGRCADFWCTIATWSPQPKNELVGHAFGRQALPMTWDFGEINPFSKSGGNFIGNLEYSAKSLESVPAIGTHSIRTFDAAAPTNVSQCLVLTDPPYYDNISYADLSDFFYVWMRRTLRQVFPSEFSTLLVPKALELVATPYRFEGGQEEADTFFMDGMYKAISNLAQASVTDTPVAIYYAFKQAEVEKEGVTSTGWATFLQAITDVGFQLDGTWPVRTERSQGLKSNLNALASSIVLVCRKRPAEAPSVTRGEFLRALRAELPQALHTLQESAIAPVDMAQASIGPGMAVFSRYTAVLEADDTRMSVREALRIINAELDEYLARQEGDYDSWTRFAVTWFQQHEFDTGRYGEAETLAKARDVAVQGVVEAGILEAKAGKVRLLKRDELPDGYVPFRDNRQTVWEGCQHMIKRIESGGEEAAALLAKQLGYQADMARDLAYRLYQICERNKWAEEARSYNGLIESWREIIKIRDTLPDETTPGPAQAELAV